MLHPSLGLKESISIIELSIKKAHLLKKSVK